MAQLPATNLTYQKFAFNCVQFTLKDKSRSFIKPIVQACFAWRNITAIDPPTFLATPHRAF